mgnify:CR=1 FL=1|jgi:predicted dehydrogenase
MIKIGVLGAGHLGKIHLKLIKEIADFELIGFFDPDFEKSEHARKEFGIPAFYSVDELIEASEAVDIVTPTLSHFDCAEKAIKNSKHVFIEKPVTNTKEEAKTLINLSHEANVKVQVGHVERFNPAYIEASKFINQPMFIESHRLAQFNSRGTDVPVVLDLMIHDIDIILSLVKSNIKRISASGVAVISNTPDIANARIEFDNGCVANLTSSRISLKNMRKSRFFQKDAYVSMDFLNKKVEVVRINEVKGIPDPFAVTIDPGEGKPLKQLNFENPDIKDTNAIKVELEMFAKSILHNDPIAVTIEDGYNALDIAYAVIDKLKLSPSLFQD